MISKLLGKLKSLLFKTSAPTKNSLVNAKTITKSSKTSKKKSKKTDSKKIIQTLKGLPGVGNKSAKNLYDAGFTSTKSILEANDKDLLAVPGIGINLVKKLKQLQ